VNDATTRPALTMLHETGHIIDLYGLGTSDAFASVVEAELNDWRRAAGGTQALQRLTELGQTIVEPDKARYLRYLTMVEEIWARSYAQYIVTRSAEPELQRQLDMVRQRRPGQTLYIPRQREDGDFVSVAAEIDRLFQQQGWIVWPSP